MLSSLAVNGRNVALLDRTSPRYKTNKPNPIIFIDGKTFYQNKVIPESSQVQNKPANKPKKFYKKRVKLRKVTFPRCPINIPVQSLPEPLLLDADTGGHCNHHGCPKSCKCQPDLPERRLTSCQNRRQANVGCRSEASTEYARSSNYPVSVRRHVNFHHLENKTLIQIREARKVTDFKRILSSNAILCGAVRSQASAQLSEMLSDATVNTSFSVKRPQSAFSVWSVNNTYNFLFQSHLDSLQSVVNHKVSEKTSDNKFYNNFRDSSENRVSVTEPHLFEELYNIPEYYQQTDLIFPVSKKVLPNKPLCKKDSSVVSVVSEPANGCLNNFNVNLSYLISAGNKNDNTSINTSGEVINSDSCLENISGKGGETTISMSTTQQQGTLSHCLTNKRDLCLAEIDRSLCELDINKADVPQITLSECREIPSLQANLQPGQSFNLSVPSVECCVESRPPPTD